MEGGQEGGEVVKLFWCYDKEKEGAEWIVWWFRKGSVLVVTQLENEQEEEREV